MNTETQTAAIVKASEFTQLVAQKKEAYGALTINGLDDKQGYAAVDVARKEIKKIRVDIEKAFKAERDVLNVKVKENLAKEKEILAVVAPIENDLKAKQDIIDNEKQRIKDEDAAREKARIDARFDKINKLGVAFNGHAYSYGEATISTVDINLGSDEKIDQFISDVLTQKEVEETAKKVEAERVAKEQAEIAAAQKAEADKLAAAQAEQERIAKEQAAKAAELKAQQDAIDAEKRRIEQAKIDAENEVKRLAELEQAKKEAAEQALKDAELKRVADEKAAADAKAKSEKAAQKKALNAPEKVKLINYAKELRACVCVELSTDEAKIIMQESELKLRELLTFIQSEANKL